jgi:hypothetical protein
MNERKGVFHTNSKRGRGYYSETLVAMATGGENSRPIIHDSYSSYFIFLRPLALIS